MKELTPGINSDHPSNANDEKGTVEVQCKSEEIEGKLVDMQITLEVTNPLKDENSQNTEGCTTKESKPDKCETEVSQLQAKVVASAPYEIPSWSGVPGVEFSIEVLKDGCVVDRLDTSKKGAYMFGRSDRVDFLLEHPSLSRYHAVLQLKGDASAFIFDLGSTHGTYVNKQKVKPRVYVPLRVGDVLRFGLSTRLYCFQGPSDLMPEEGLSQVERQALKMKKMLAFKKQLEEKKLDDLRKKENEGISWGMGEDAEDDEEEEEEEKDLASKLKGKLSENQKKLVEKINKKKEKISHLEREIKAIEAKEMSQGGLREGQQTQIERNRQRVAVLTQEIETLEETLEDSFSNAEASKKARNKIKVEEEDVYSDEDQFYDRVGNKKGKKKKSFVTDESKGAEIVQTAESLIGQREKLLKEIEELREKVMAMAELVKLEEQPDAQSVNEDPLDQFMDSVVTEIKKDKVSLEAQHLSSLESELMRVKALISVADPTGEEERKWREKGKRLFPKPIMETIVPVKISTATAEMPTGGSKVNVIMKAEEEKRACPEQRKKELVESADEKLSILEKDNGVKEVEEVRDSKKEDPKIGKDVIEEISKKSSRIENNEPKTEAKNPPAPKRRKMGPERPQWMSEQEMGEVDVWVPPSGQTGDGRLSLNEKLGY